MRLELINEISKSLPDTQKRLVEKDIILHEILSNLSNNEYFASNYLFKGGTCLVKTYLGYVRFSEDLDFTWKDQGVFSNMSGKKISAHASEQADILGEILQEISTKHSL